MAQHHRNITSLSCKTKIKFVGKNPIINNRPNNLIRAEFLLFGQLHKSRGK